MLTLCSCNKCQGDVFRRVTDEDQDEDGVPFVKVWSSYCFGVILAANEVVRMKNGEASCLSCLHMLDSFVSMLLRPCLAFVFLSFIKSYIWKH